MYVPHVRSNGRADLTLGDSSTGYFEWRSPSGSRPPAGTPAGVTDVRVKCEVHVNFGPKHPYAPSLSDNSLSSCRDALILPPRCTLADIWARAKREGAPDGAVASIMLASEHWHDDEHNPDEPTPGQWNFSIDDVDGKKDFNRSFADDCGAPANAAGEDDASATGEAAELVPPDDTTFRVVAKKRVILKACFDRATAPHPAIEAVDARFALHVDERGRVDHVTAQAEMDIEGLFMGSLDTVTAEFTRCAGKTLALLSFPPLPAGENLRVIGVRLERKEGKLTSVPLTRAQIRSISR
jgi:hypothetical protein